MESAPLRAAVHPTLTFTTCLLLALAALAALAFAPRLALAQPAWPAESAWTWLANDPEEGGDHNDQRDVESLYFTVQDGYLYLRMKNRGPAGWCRTCGQSREHARYKWLFDTAGGDGVLQGGSVYNTEFPLMVEDNDDNLTGEITFIDSVAGEYNDRWDSTNPPRYVTNTPVGAPFPDDQRVIGAVDPALMNPVPDPDTTPYLGIPQIGMNAAVGYRIAGDDGSAPPYTDGIHVDMYIDIDLLGAPTSLRLMWLTDQEDENLNQAPCCDQPDDGAFNIIPLTGNLTIEKSVPGDNAQDFAFTLTPPAGAPTAFDLDDDTDPALPALRTFTDLEPGRYSVAESAVAGWSLTSLTCINQNGVASSFTTDLAAGTASIDLVAGGDVRCRFVNAAEPTPGSYSLVVVKHADPTGPQAFEFSVTDAGNPVDSFPLSDPGNASHAVALTAGTPYVLSETAVAGWDTTLACSDPSVVVSGASATLPDTIADGSVVTCEYTNVQRAIVRIAKQATEASPGSFDFTSTLPGAANFSLASGGTRTESGVAPGSYSVSELVPAGYVLQSITCSDTTGRSQFETDLSSAKATLEVAAGGDITCTFRNGQQGNLVIIKDAVPDDAAQAFAFTTGMANFSLTDDGSTAGNCATPAANTRCFESISPIDYPVRETVPAGWTLESIACTGGSAVVDLPNATVTASVPPGGTVVCTFTNRPVPPGTYTLTVTKDAQPDDPQAFDFTLLENGAPFGSFQLSDPTDPSRQFVLTTGNAYQLDEAAVAGWTGSWSCSDPAITASGTRAILPATIAADALVTCTAVNRRVPPPAPRATTIPGLQGAGLVLLALLLGGL